MHQSLAHLIYTMRPGLKDIHVVGAKAVETQEEPLKIETFKRMLIRHENNVNECSWNIGLTKRGTVCVCASPII